MDEFLHKQVTESSKVGDWTEECLFGFVFLFHVLHSNSGSAVDVVLQGPQTAADKLLLVNLSTLVNVQLIEQLPGPLNSFALSVMTIILIQLSNIKTTQYLRLPLNLIEITGEFRHFLHVN